jgi:DNA-binding NarL/FixJ family response regulator
VLPQNTVRLLIAASVRVYRDGLMLALHNRGGIEVVGASEDCQTTLVQASALAPDVVAIDMQMPGALDAIAGLRQDASAAKIVAFMLRDDESEILPVLEAGASAYVTVASPLDGLVAAVERVARDEVTFAPHITALLLRRLTARASVADGAADTPHLTRREQEVLRLMRHGLSNKEIGGSLHIAEATVKNHVHHILEKLAVRSRRHAIARLAGLSGL